MSQEVEQLSQWKLSERHLIKLMTFPDFQKQSRTQNSSTNHDKEGASFIFSELQCRQQVLGGSYQYDWQSEHRLYNLNQKM